MVQKHGAPVCFFLECEAHCYRGLPPVTMIRLEGLWLERMGFHPGDKIVVTSKQGEIFLRRADQESYDVASSGAS